MWIWRGARGAVRGGGKFRRSSRGEISIRRHEADTLFNINAIMRLASFVPWPILYISSHVHIILPPRRSNAFPLLVHSAHLRPRLCNHDAPSLIQSGMPACTWSARTFPMHSNLLTPVDVKRFSFWFSLMWFIHLEFFFFFFKCSLTHSRQLKRFMMRNANFLFWAPLWRRLNMLMWPWWLMVLRIDSSLPLNPGPAAHLWCAEDLLLPTPQPTHPPHRSVRDCDRWPTACQRHTIFQFPVGGRGIPEAQRQVWILQVTTRISKGSGEAIQGSRSSLSVKCAWPDYRGGRWQEIVLF